MRTDGGIRTGRDVVMAAMMGAEEFGIGTAALVAMGCIMVRQCHSNTCPVGVCTQDEKLRAKFTGTPEKVVNLFSFIAEEVREILASLGFRKLEEVIGRTDLLSQISRGAEELDDLDLNPLLVQADPGNHARYSTQKGRNEVPDTLDAQIEKDAHALLDHGEKMQLAYTVRNTMRSIGARISSRIVRKWGMTGLPPGHLTLRLRGSCGQSLGAFCRAGPQDRSVRRRQRLCRQRAVGRHDQLAADDVGELRGAATTPSSATRFSMARRPGKLFAAGQAGERFAVRNSGATAVVEGCGSNGCEYMTGGTAVILGRGRRQFRGRHDRRHGLRLRRRPQFSEHVNPDSVVWQRIETAHWQNVLRS